MRQEHPFRAPTEFERDVIRSILAADSNANALQAQLSEVEVRTIDEYGSIEIRSRASTAEMPQVPMHKVDAEGQAADSDGVAIHFLLFEQGGWLCELQIYKDDGTQIRHLPEADAVAVMLLR